MKIRKTGEINSSQFFVMFFLINIGICFTFSPLTLSSKNLYNSILSIILSLALTLVLLIPIYMLNRKTRVSVMENASQISSVLSFIVKAVYIIYFLYCASYICIIFADFFSSYINPETPKILVVIIMCACSLYSGLKGFEALSRSSLLIFVLSIILFLYVVLGNIPNFALSNIKEINLKDVNNLFFENTIFFISTSFLIPSSCVLLHKVKGKKGAKTLSWITAIYLFIAVTVIVLAASLGNYAYTQQFPVYVLSKSTQLNITKGVAGAAFALITACIFIAMSLFLICLNNTISKSRSRLWSVIFEITIFLIILCAISFESIQALFINKVVLLVLTLITGFIIPLFLLPFSKRRCKNEDK